MRRLRPLLEGERTDPANDRRVDGTREGVAGERRPRSVCNIGDDKPNLVATFLPVSLHFHGGQRQNPQHLHPSAVELPRALQVRPCAGSQRSLLVYDQVQLQLSLLFPAAGFASCLVLEHGLHGPQVVAQPDRCRDLATFLEQFAGHNAADVRWRGSAIHECFESPSRSEGGIEQVYA